MAMRVARSVERVVGSVWQAEGRGARVRRSIGRAELAELDPFLLLDEFEGSRKDGAGFPDHPHRGFETVTYVLEGEMTHEDFKGNHGVIRAGDLQWMTAGRGVMHSEMPGWETTRGLQLWVNLARKQKMVEPSYQELTASEVPVGRSPGVEVRVVAGTALGTTSPVRTLTPTSYLDFTLQPGAAHQQPLPAHWNTFIYVLMGSFRFAGKLVNAHSTVVFKQDGEVVEMENVGEEQGRLVMVAGRPLGEPVARRGPFVMSTKEEIEQAVKDFTRGENGFEGARQWKFIEGNK